MTKRYQPLPDPAPPPEAELPEDCFMEEISPAPDQTEDPREDPSPVGGVLVHYI